MRVYIDSNVIISLFREEIGKDLRALYIDAESFFAKTVIVKDTIVISQLVLEEVEKICKINEQ